MTTLLDYYRRREMDPVPLNLETAEALARHRAKRINLYDRHLGIPFGFLEGREVLEFGCNTGENALVLAEAGARVTLVEPNPAAHPRLQALFGRFGLADRLVAVVAADMAGFADERRYDLVIAEGFLNTLADRDAMLRKMVGLMKPRGLGIVSFDDRYGGLIELIKRLVHWRACALAGMADVFSPDSLALARRLFGEDFAALDASRPFAAWWEDQLVNPFALALWSFAEILGVLEPAGARLRRVSPVWTGAERMAWYKNVPPPKAWGGGLAEEWLDALPYFLTGRPLARPDLRDGAAAAAEAVADLVAAIAGHTADYPATGAVPRLAPVLSAYLDALVPELAAELERVLGPAGDGLDGFVAGYHACPNLRRIWGSLYHYLCFERSA